MGWDTLRVPLDSPSRDSNPKAALLVILVAALAVRLLGVVLMQDAQVSDAVTYDRLARTIVVTHSYTFGGQLSAWWPVGYPAFLSLVYAIFGMHPLAGQLANAVLGTLSVWLVYQLGSWFGRPTAIVGATVVALLPSHVMATNLLTTETLCTTLWLAGAVSGWRAPTSPRMAVASGISFGLATLVRPTSQVLGLAWPVGSWLLARRDQRLWYTPLIAVLAMAATLTPWVIRNRSTFGRGTVSTNGGFNLWVGNNPLASGNYLLSDGQHSFEMAQSDLLVNRDANEVQQDDDYRRRAVAFIVNNPGRVVLLAFKKLRYLWLVDNDAVSWALAGYHNGQPPPRWLYVCLHSSALLAYWVVIAATLVGLVQFASTLPRDWMLLLPPTLLTAIHAVYVGDDRYHFPALPFLVVFAAHGLIRLRERRTASAFVVTGSAMARSSRESTGAF